VTNLVPEVLSHLERLVAFDTQNPPRRIGGDGIFTYLVERLGSGFSTALTDLGDGCVSLLAVRGAPRLLVNVHVDTVPAGEGWSTDPFRLEVSAGRAVGRGAADVKGAAACLLAAAARSSGDAALLFTSDEEAGSSRCVKAFLAERRAFEAVLVAEPTRCRAVLEHRGIATCTGRFSGVPGHASSPRALADSALHEAVRWSARALSFAEESESTRHGALAGIRFNLGVLEGGTKANMIAGAASLRFGVRPMPGAPPEALVEQLTALAPRAERVAWELGFVAPPLPAPGASAGPARALADSLGLAVGEAVDFWTEAALFSAAGLPSLVYGPGDIEQAHTAGEWIALDELAVAAAFYARLMDLSGSGARGSS
jgi:acetylornithine deacetylase